MRRRWFLRLSALMLCLALIITGLIVLELQATQITALRRVFEHYRTALTAIRLSAIALLAIAWPKLVRIAERRGWITSIRSTELHALRWRVVTWLLLIELLLGQNLVNRVWQTETGMPI